VTATSDVVYRMSPDWSQMWQLDGHSNVRDAADFSKNWLNEYIHPDDKLQVTAAIAKSVSTKGLFEPSSPSINACTAL